MEKNDAKMNYFSQKTGKFYQILPTKTVPALRINAVPMHRFAKIDPAEHTRRIIAAAVPHGKVLDICTGLGYTAISSAKIRGVKEVTTIEKDSEVLGLCRINEASSGLFKNPKIKIAEGDAAEKIKEFGSDYFDCVIHDPPTYVIAPELYTKSFCAEIFRVLKKGGILWHYTPEPGKAKGKKENLRERIMTNLGKIGFIDVEYDGYSTGITCKKP